MPVRLSHPAYYYSMVARLYYFDGEEQPGLNTLVVSFQEMVSSEGIHYKVISSAKLFSSYADAKTYISSQELTDYNIMGVPPLGNVVVKYEERVSEEGIRYEEITHFIFFPIPYYNYKDAEAFILSQQTGNYRILDLFVSPVPLEALDSYQLVHESDATEKIEKIYGTTMPPLKIFKYLGPGEP